MFQKTEISQRQYCKKCGGHLMTNHPPLRLVDVFATTLPTLLLRDAPQALLDQFDVNGRKSLITGGSPLALESVLHERSSASIP